MYMKLLLILGERQVEQNRDRLNINVYNLSHDLYLSEMNEWKTKSYVWKQSSKSNYFFNW